MKAQISWPKSENAGAELGMPRRPPDLQEPSQGPHLQQLSSPLLPQFQPHFVQFNSERPLSDGLTPFEWQDLESLWSELGPRTLLSSSAQGILPARGLPLAEHEQEPCLPVFRVGQLELSQLFGQPRPPVGTTVRASTMTVLRLQPLCLCRWVSSLLHGCLQHQDTLTPHGCEESLGAGARWTRVHIPAPPGPRALTLL